MAIRKQREQIPLVDKEKFHGYFHYCHKFGHKVADYRAMGEDQRLKRKQDTNIEHGEGKANSIAHEKMWKKELEDSEETQISIINEVSKVDVEHNEVIYKNDIDHEGKLLSDVEENPNEDKDERDKEGYSDCGILF